MVRFRRSGVARFIVPRCIVFWVKSGEVFAVWLSAAIIRRGRFHLPHCYRSNININTRWQLFWVVYVFAVRLAAASFDDGGFTYHTTPAVSFTGSLTINIIRCYERSVDLVSSGEELRVEVRRESLHLSDEVKVLCPSGGGGVGAQAVARQSLASARLRRGRVEVGLVWVGLGLAGARPGGQGGEGLGVCQFVSWLEGMGVGVWVGRVWGWVGG